MMRTLIVGGSSGLGLALAKRFTDQADEVIVTGRTKPDDDFARFIELNLAQGDLPAKIKDFIKELPDIGRLVHAAGFYQPGTVTDLSAGQIESILDVTGRSLIYAVKYLLEKQGDLRQLITITSTSQWSPRKMEPIYNFTKAGVGQFSNSMSLDGRISKVLVVAPSAMHPDFGSGAGDNTEGKLLDKEWVAAQIVEENQPEFKYKLIKILSQPPRVEVADKR
jgi:short-subunit dehydrogenase